MDSPRTDHLADPALLTLLLAGGPLAPRRQLLQSLGSARAVLDAGPPHWRRAGLVPAQCRALLHPDATALGRAMAWLSASAQHHLIGLTDPGCPALLAHTPEPPLAVFASGNPRLLLQPLVAIVGSRNASPSGCAIAQQLAGELCAHGLGVASGLAAGIDAAAHRAGLQAGGCNVAVIGTGLDRAYPASHHPLQQQLASQGVVISEYPPGTPPRPGHFPARNRLLAGLSLAVIVVEAAQRSGAMITARLAAEAGREVFAVPGSPLNPLSRGCNRLLRDGAGLLESIQDLLPAVPALTQLASLQPPMEAAASSTLPTDANLRRLCQALDGIPVDLDELALRTGLTVAGLSAMLLDLELAGQALQLHGRWQRAPHPPSITASIDAGRG